MTTTAADGPAARDLAHPHHGPTPWWRYLSLIRPEAADMGTIVIYGVAGAVLTLAVPLTVDALISNITFGTLLTPLVVLVSVLLGCLCMQALLRALQVFVAEVIERRIFVRVAGDLAWRLPRVKIEAFDNRHGPELVNRFFDTVTLQKTTTKLLLTVTNVVLQTAVGMAVLSFYHPFLFVFVVVLVFAVVILLFAFGWRGVDTQIAESHRKYDVAAWLQELARHTTAFCTKGGADFALARTDQLCRGYVAARKQHFRVLFRQVCGALVLQIAASTAVLAIGGWLVIDQQLTPGQLVASELIVTAVVANLAKLGEILQGWYDVCSAADKIGHLIDLPLERQDGAALPRKAPGVAIDMHNVGCGAPDGPNAVREFTLSIRPGERIALVGSNGGSASYLLDVFFGLRDPKTGHVTVDGLDLRQLRLDSTRDEFALVHGTELVEGTIEQNVLFGRQGIGPDQLRDALAAVELWDEIMQLPGGLQTPLTTRGLPLNSSQASRLMLARAILGEPRLLMLDGALDVLTPPLRRRIMKHLFAPRHGWTVMIVTQEHDVAEACDRRIELEPLAPAGAEDS